MRRAILFALALLLAAPAAAQERTRLDGEAVQGGFLVGQTEPGTALMLEMRPVPVAADGTFVIGFDRDAPETAILHIRYPDGREEAKTVAIRQREFRIQRIDGVPQRYVDPPAAVIDRIIRELWQVRYARADFRDMRHFLQTFEWPVTGRITGVYGSQRIYNGVPRRYHSGLDISAVTGTPIRAPAPGIVVLTGHLYFAGKTVILDHGHGIFSTYIHMSEIAVEEGQQVATGEVLGQVGTTGRTLGAHLHWGLNWYDVRLDPQLLMGPMPGGN